MRIVGVTRLFTLSVLTALSVSSVWADGPERAPGDLDREQSFAIEAQSLDAALLDFSDQANVQVMVAASTVEGLQTDGVEGAYTPRTALAALLDDNNLEFTAVGNTLAVMGSGQGGDSDSGNGRTAGATPRPVMMAQAVTEQSQTSQKTEAESDKDEERRPIEEIIVTGTHIRGVRNMASPLVTFGRDDIDATGFSTAQDFLRSQPQVFLGGPSETQFLISTANETHLNPGGGTGVNLRGLGTDATLVLLNGHRLAPAGFGNFADVSMIPVTAIDRVDMVLDGASAIYGSDAVGGVVNFILREDYEGAETRLRYGTVTDGGRNEVVVGQTFGKSWASGQALISLEYREIDPLDANDRSFTEDSPDPFALLPEQEQVSVLLNASQHLSERLKLFGDAFYSVRDSDSVGTTDFASVRTTSETEQIGGTLGFGVDLGDTWHAELVGTFSRNDTESKSRSNRFSAGVIRTTFTDNQSTTGSLDAIADGPVFQLPGGDVGVAIGGHYRRERFVDDDVDDDDDVDEDRDIFAVFGEASIPIVGAENRVPGIERLELSLAARHEDYSDFGTSTDPKVGVLWSPKSGLNLRATWGTSFRAPLFRELAETNVNGFLVDGIPDPLSPTGTTLTVFALGNNPDLQPEEATTVTAGIDFQPAQIPGLNIGLTYFDIEFKDRIDSVVAFLDAFTDPQFAPIIDRNPDPAFIEFLESQPSSGNFTTMFDFSDAEALVDLRLRNTARLQISGLDLNASYGLDSDIGRWDFTLSGTYLSGREEKLLEASEPVDQLNTVSNPVDLRLRGGISWRRGGLATNLFINFTDSYKDIRSTPAVSVDSWTTVDLNLSYSTENFGNSLLDNTKIALNIQNLADEDPPFVGSFFFDRNINFDSDNASALGRFISLQITKQW